jgi:hypothetical protein
MTDAGNGKANRGRRQGLKQFLDDKSYPPGNQAMKRGR